MITHSYYLNDPQKEETRLMLALRKKGDKRSTLSISLPVLTKYWDDKVGDFKKEAPEYKFYSEKLTGIRKKVRVHPSCRAGKFATICA